MMDQVSKKPPAVQQKKHESWQWQMQNRITDPAEVFKLPGWSGSSYAKKFKELSESSLKTIKDRFLFSVTPYYLSLADPADPKCPVANQIMLHEYEANDPLFLKQDALEEDTYMPVKNLTHRYPNKVLWYTSHVCAFYCRFCMRKRKVSNPQSAPTMDEVNAAIAYIKSHKEIQEVILSGGDPFTLTDRNLIGLIDQLSQINHIFSIRIHTRIPVTLPMRVTEELSSALQNYSNLSIITHFNTHKEITYESSVAIKRLRKAGLTVRNQAVLLKNVNNSEQSLKALFLGLIKIGVHPYYLHQCDEIQGVSHFMVPIQQGIELMKSLRGKLPGIAMPEYVIDLPGGGGKVPIDSSYFQKINPDGSVIFKNFQDQIYRTVPFPEK